MDEIPPEEAYGRVTNAERFASLHDVVTRLVDRLSVEFDVERDDNPSLPGHIDVKTETAVRLVPLDAGAPVTLVRTTFPGAYAAFGESASSLYPSCGCDACNEDPEMLAEQLEADVVAVIQGGLTEYRNRKGESGYRLDYRDQTGYPAGSQSSTPRGRLRERRWPAWTRRADSSSGTLGR